MSKKLHILFATYQYYQILLFTSKTTFSNNTSTLVDVQQAHPRRCKFKKISRKFGYFVFQVKKYYINKRLHQQEFFGVCYGC